MRNLAESFLDINAKNYVENNGKMLMKLQKFFFSLNYVTDLYHYQAE